jgi:hypothetical protein
MAKRKRKIELPEDLRKQFVEQGRIGGQTGGSAGGKKRVSMLTPAEHTALAKKAAAARWKGRVPKTKAKKKAKP